MNKDHISHWWIRYDFCSTFWIWLCNEVQHDFLKLEEQTDISLMGCMKKLKVEIYLSWLTLFLCRTCWPSTLCADGWLCMAQFVPMIYMAHFVPMLIWRTLFLCLLQHGALCSHVLDTYLWTDVHLILKFKYQMFKACVKSFNG